MTAAHEGVREDSLHRGEGATLRAHGSATPHGSEASSRLGVAGAQEQRRQAFTISFCDGIWSFARARPVVAFVPLVARD